MATREYNQQWRLEHKERIREYRKRPMYKYHTQKARAKMRGIPWELTFEQWWGLWEDSGKWMERGKQGEQYCMCRVGDAGPYSIDNVRIDTMIQNTKERFGKR